MKRRLEARLTELERRTETATDLVLVLYKPGTQPPEYDGSARTVLMLPDNGRDRREDEADAHET